MTTTTYLQLNQPAYNSSAWDVPLNANETILDNAFGATTSVSLTNSNVNLTSTQIQAMQFRLTGTLSANVTIYIPAGYYGRWTVRNATTGSYTVTMASAAGGTTLAIPQGYSYLICCDSTGVFAADSAVAQTTSFSTLTVTGNATLGTNSSNTLTVNSTSTFSSPQTFSATSTLNGSASTLASVIKNIVEPVTVSSSAATGTIEFDVLTQSILYYTLNASANFTIDVRGNSGTTLNSIMSTGQAITIAFLNTNGSTAYYNTAVTIDGASVTPKWQGGTAPSSGNANALDIYTYTIIKTGASTYTVVASLTQCA